MTKEDNIVIAESCGYVPCDMWVPFNSKSLIRGNCGHAKCYPRNAPIRIRYNQSLDAISEAVRMQDEEFQHLFALKLHELAEHHPRSPFECKMIHKLTAEQWASCYIATLKALGRIK